MLGLGLYTTHRRSQEFVLGGTDNRGADMKPLEASRGKGMETVHLPSRLRGLWERRKLLSGVAEKRVLE